MLHFVIMIFVLSIFEWPFYTGLTVDGLLTRLLFNLIMLVLVLHVEEKLMLIHAKRQRSGPLDSCTLP